ncbi:MAG: TadE family protein [Chloroflexota bacterium]
MRAHARGEGGQAMVEFAMVLLPVLLIVVGIIQFGLLFGANVTLTNAAREGARAGTVYVYDHSQSRLWNDAHRCGTILAATRGSMGFLSTNAPNFSATLNGDGSCPTPSGETQVNGSISVAYCGGVTTPDAPCPDGTDPDTTCTPETREDCLLRVTVRYRSAIIVPFMGDILGSGSGLFDQSAAVTMVLN